jgi:hypothetical protein
MLSPKHHLYLLQIEPHIHLAVHRRGGGEVFLGFLPLARAPVELAEAEVAVAMSGRMPSAPASAGASRKCAAASTVLPFVPTVTSPSTQSASTSLPRSP